VAVELASLEEVGERELLEHRRAEVVERLLAAHRIEQRAGQHEPAGRRPGASSLLAPPA
jgi:hypothetical protein